MRISSVFSVIMTFSEIILSILGVLVGELFTILALIMLPIWILSVIIVFYLDRKEKKEKEKKEQKIEKRIKKQEKKEKKRLEKEEKKFRPDISFSIKKNKLNDIEGYITNSRLNIKINNSDLIDKILYIKNVHDGKTAELDLENNDGDNFIYDTQELFPDSGEYILIVCSKSKEGYKYRTKIKVRHVKNEQISQQYWKIIKGSKILFIQKGKRWKNIQRKLRKRKKDGRILRRNKIKTQGSL